MNNDKPNVFFFAYAEDMCDNIWLKDVLILCILMLSGSGLEQSSCHWVFAIKLMVWYLCLLRQKHLYRDEWSHIMPNIALLRAFTSRREKSSLTLCQEDMSSNWKHLIRMLKYHQRKCALIPHACLVFI